MTVDFSKPVVLNTSKYSSIENSNDIVFIKPETVKIDVKEHESKKIFNVSATRIVIIRFPFCSPEEEKSIKRKKTADMVLNLSSYTTNDSDDGNCGTEIKHDIEPEF